MAMSVFLVGVPLKPEKRGTLRKRQIQVGLLLVKG